MGLVALVRDGMALGNEQRFQLPRQACERQALAERPGNGPVLAIARGETGSGWLALTAAGLFSWRAASGEADLARALLPSPGRSIVTPDIAEP